MNKRTLKRYAGNVFPGARAQLNCHASILSLAFLVALLASPNLRAQGARDLWKVNADGGGLKLLAESPGYLSGSPDWSPDGKLIAYDTRKIGEGYPGTKIGIIRPDGKDRHLIGPGAMPSWSPDGKQLVAHTYDNPQTIVVMNADGTGREAIIKHWGSPRWSPRGNRVASLLDDGIALYDMATGTETVIVRGPHPVHLGFAISPDGKRFCFGGTDGGIYLATLDEERMTSKVRPLANFGRSYHASFAPDGKRVVYSWGPDDAKPIQLYIRDVDADDDAKPIAGQDVTRDNMNPDWSPDGKTIVFVSQPRSTAKDRL